MVRRSSLHRISHREYGPHGHGPYSQLGSGESSGAMVPCLFRGPPSLQEATMSYARPVHQQQLPTVGSVAGLINAIVFILLVVVPGALTLLGLLVSKFML